MELGHSYTFDIAGGAAGVMVEPLRYLALVNARYEIGRQTCGRVLLVLLNIITLTQIINITYSSTTTIFTTPTLYS